MSEILKIHLRMYEHLTKCAKLSAMLITTKRKFPVLKKRRNHPSVVIISNF